MRVWGTVDPIGRVGDISERSGRRMGIAKRSGRRISERGVGGKGDLGRVVLRGVRHGRVLLIIGRRSIMLSMRVSNRNVGSGGNLSSTFFDS